MRFLRILPAVWAMISCPFSSFTRKVALGSSSETIPGNSRSSSFAIPFLWRACGRSSGRHVHENRAEDALGPSKIKSPNIEQPVGRALKRQRADQREQPARGQEIDCDLALKAFAQQGRAVVMQAAPAHVDGLEARRRIVQRRIIALA